MKEFSFDPIPSIAEELHLAVPQVRRVVALLDEGGTVPFIARYRKELTGNLDEVQIRSVQERRDALVALQERRQTILASIESQGKLTEDLKHKIATCQTQTALEDLYIPYKPKRRTKAAIAREKGLEPLAQLILSQPDNGDPDTDAMIYVDHSKGVDDVAAALEGARHIVAEVAAENADIRTFVRECFANDGVIVSKVVKEHEGKPTKWNQYYDFMEPVRTIPSHRYLAIKRGEREEVLKVHISIENDIIDVSMRRLMGYRDTSPYASQLAQALEDSYKRLLRTSVETDVFVDLKIKSDDEAINVFAQNLETVLLAAPLGEKGVIGIDPGVRTGCKCAAVTSTGKFVDTITLYLHGGAREVKATTDFLAFVKKYAPYAIAVGNGTGGRETEAFVRKVLKTHDFSGILVVPVSESGASVYSASDVARDEFPDLDLTIRGAVSIARRLQDPLAEIVKVDPKSIGIGQYQHDVYQPALERKLHEVVESCVNRVGVELNTASASLLGYVAGIGTALAKKIVAHRDRHGAFADRQQLFDVDGLGPKTFQQAAGFLRIRQGKNPLDASAVHPERYGVVEAILHDLNASLNTILGNEKALRSVDTRRYLSEDLGELTLRDIVDELRKPGRDPRRSFEPPAFRDDITSIGDLRPGMVLEGVVTNVTAFGAFVDVGVHQDGLVHVSQLSEQFVRNPNDVVHAGDKLKVQVVDVDLDLKRIALTARIGSGAPNSTATKTVTGMRQMPSNKKGKEAFLSSPFATL